MGNDIRLITVRRVLKNNNARYITLPLGWADGVDAVALYEDGDTLVISRNTKINPTTHQPNARAIPKSTQRDRAIAYLRDHPAATYAQVRAAVGCGQGIVRVAKQIIEEEGSPTDPGGDMMRHEIEQLRAFRAAVETRIHAWRRDVENPDVFSPGPTSDSVCDDILALLDEGGDGESLSVHPEHGNEAELDAALADTCGPDESPTWWSHGERSLFEALHILQPDHRWPFYVLFHETLDRLINEATMPGADGLP